jgi:hypothetical protein
MSKQETPEAVELGRDILKRGLALPFASKLSKHPDFRGTVGWDGDGKLTITTADSADLQVVQNVSMEVLTSPYPELEEPEPPTPEPAEEQ